MHKGNPMKKGVLILCLLTFLLYACSQPEPDAVFGKEAYKTGEKIPLIFSHDGAPDDVAALVYIAKHPDIDLLGVVQSYGAQHPGASFSTWSVFLYDVLNYDSARMGVGSEVSMDPVRNAFSDYLRDGADRFWDQDLPQPAGAYVPEDGVQMLVELIHASEQKVTLLVTGAQTDIALALKEDPTIAGNIAQIVIMGGAFNVKGNLYQPSGKDQNSSAEWNIFVDPLAAKQVFTSGIPLTIVPLDGSDNFLMRRADHAKIESSDDPGLQVLSGLWDMVLSQWGDEFQIWDLVTATALTNPELFEWKYDGVDVIADPGPTHGRTFQLNNGAKNSRFAVSANNLSIRKQVFAILLEE